MAADERGEAEQAIAGTRDGEAESAADRETRLRSENARLRFDLHKVGETACGVVTATVPGGCTFISS